MISAMKSHFDSTKLRFDMRELRSVVTFAVQTGYLERRPIRATQTAVMRRKIDYRLRTN